MNKSRLHTMLILMAPIFTWIGLTSVFVFGEFSYVFFGPDTYHLTLFIALELVVIGVLVAPAFWQNDKFSKLAKSAPLLVSIGAIVWLASFPEVIKYSPNFYPIKVSLFKNQDHKNCIANSVEWETAKKLGICEKIDHGHDYVDAFFYDSNDQLSLSKDKRSPAWTETAKRFIGDFGGDQDGISIKPLGDHFYFVSVDYAAFEGAHL